MGHGRHDVGARGRTSVTSSLLSVPSVSFFAVQFSVRIAGAGVNAAAWTTSFVGFAVLFFVTAMRSGNGLRHLTATSPTYTLAVFIFHDPVTFVSFPPPPTLPSFLCRPRHVVYMCVSFTRSQYSSLPRLFCVDAIARAVVCTVACRSLRRRAVAVVAVGTETNTKLEKCAPP